MSLLDVEEVKGLMSTGIEDGALQGVIDREETWLAAKIGPLTDELTEKLRPTDRHQPILLRRPTTGDLGPSGDVAVTDAGVDVDGDDLVLEGGTVIRRLSGRWAGPVVEITYTPNDEDSVRRVLLELVRLTLTASPYQSESSESHSYTRPTDLERQRAQLAKTLDPHRGPHTLVVSR